MPMASLNVAEWSTEQVADWLTGLGPTVARYVPALRERGLDGAKLLTLRCDDLEYLGMHVIGHQELLLEAVEHLRNFQYEVSRECVQQLALRVSVVATTLARALRHHTDARLETQTLADVARTVHAVKPLVCWLDRWAAGGAGLAARKAALLQHALEAAACAQRERFADQPARAVAAAAAGAACAADYIIQDVADPMVLQPASLDTVTLRQGNKPLGFDVVPSFCGHHQLADIRFGSPAHASGAVHIGDEIVQVGNQCVIGWSGAAVVRACAAAGAELALRLRRRAARAPPALPRRRARAPDSDSEPASPTQLHARARMYPPKPRALHQRRHTISGDGSLYKRPSHTIERFWQELKQQRWGAEGGSASMTPAPDDVALYARDKAVSCSTGLELSPRPRTCLGVVTDRPTARLVPVAGTPAPSSGPPPPSSGASDSLAGPPGPSAGPSAGAPGLAGVPPDAAATTPGPAPEPPGQDDAPTPDRSRGKMDKSHSTPAYDFDASVDEPVSIAAQAIPESPTTPIDSPLALHSAYKADRILDFKKSSSQIGEAILQRGRRSNADVPAAVNVAMLQQRRRPAPPAALPTTAHRPPRSSTAGAASPPTRPAPPPRPGGTGPGGTGPGGTGAGGTGPGGTGAAPQYPVLRAVPREEPPASPLKPRGPVDSTHIPIPAGHSPKRAAGDIVVGAQAQADAAPSPGRSIFPSSKSRSLKKKSSILARRRQVPAAALAARGAAGGVWQRVRARGQAQARWARRHLLLAHSLLYAYRSPECAKADCMIYLEGCTVAAAAEVKSRAFAFKVYHTGSAFYFACDSRDAQLAWIQLIHRATLLPSLATNMDVSKQFSETDYSETESDADSPRERERPADKEKDKSKFGSLKKLTHRMQRSDSADLAPHAATSLDRKYLRFFYRNKAKDDTKTKDDIKTKAAAGADAGRPQPHNYIHASNPNLLDFDKSDFVARPALHVPKPKPKTEKLVGLVTLEQFMLRKQAEERRQLYSNRVLLGVDTQHRHLLGVGSQHRDLLQRLHTIVPDVVYGEVCAGGSGGPGGPAGGAAGGPAADRPARGSDGYEKIVHRDDAPPDRWRDSLRRNHKVHSAQADAEALKAPAAAQPPHARDRTRAARQYPHLQCPPTFQPETYSLARRPPRDAPR